MKKVLVSLAVCGLSVCGSCLGLSTGPWEANYFSKSSNFIEVSNQDGEFRKVNPDIDVNKIDSNKVEVVKASEDFIEDLKKVDEKKIAGQDLARKWGTKDGKIYCVGDRNVFLRWLSEGFDGKTQNGSFRFFSYFGEPREGLIQKIEETDRSIKRMTNAFNGMKSDFEHFFDRFFEVPFFFASSLTFDSYLRSNANRFRIRESENALHFLKDKSQESKLGNSDSKTAAVGISSPKKKNLGWLKDISLFATGGLVVGGLITLKTNPDFYKNAVKSMNGLISAKKISNFCKNVKTTMSGFISNHFAS